jgi:hypothetical protein
MTCTLCSNELQAEDKVIQMPCCPAIYHTMCYLQRSAYHNYGIMSCFTCNTHVVGTYNSYGQSPPITPEPTPEFLAAAKELKKAFAEKNKGLKAVNQLVRTTHATFKQNSAEAVASLKALKKNAIASIQQTPQWRSYMSSMRRARALRDKFQREFDPDRQVIGTIVPARNLLWRGMYPMHGIHRKFRFRL